MARLEEFAATQDVELFCERHGLKANRDWSPSEAQKALRRSKSIANSIELCSYRPFDNRFTLVGSEVMDYPRREIVTHLKGRNGLALNAVRQTNKRGFKHVLASIHPPESCLVSTGTREGSYVFPLWLQPDGLSNGVRANLSAKVTGRLTSLTSLAFGQSTLITEGAVGAFGPEDVFHWTYAILHSRSYRERYTDDLKSDFARVPLPANVQIFEELVLHGHELARLHILDSEHSLLSAPKVRFVAQGQPQIGRTQEIGRDESGRVYVNSSCWFETISSAVWDHWIGGFQPAQKWLKDRAATGGKKPTLGRVLTPEDQLHYRRIIVALERTAEIMTEIDRVIERHGGWPDAFRGMKD